MKKVINYVKEHIGMICLIAMTALIASPLVVLLVQLTVNH